MKNIILALLVGLSLVGCATVDTGYRGVVLSWGKPTGETKTEGISFLMPFSGYDVKALNVQTQSDAIETDARSKDSQVVKTSVTINYHLDPTQVIAIFDQLRYDEKERVLDPTVHDAVTAATGKFKAQDLVANRDGVASAIDSALRKKMAPYHIIIEQVLVTNIAFDQQFQQAVEQTMTAQQELATAKIEAEKAKATAIGAAQAQQAQKQTLTPLILQKQWIDKWNGVLPTVTSGNSNMLMQIPNGGSKD